MVRTEGKLRLIHMKPLCPKLGSWAAQSMGAGSCALG